MLRSSRAHFPLYQLDAFTSQAFKGNPAAVVILTGEDRDREWKQKVASEMNLSETAFLIPNTDGSYGLTWFTPTNEVRLCGHATLASIQALYEAGRLAAEQNVNFHTLSGVLKGVVQADGIIAMDFPDRTPTGIKDEALKAVTLNALGVEESDCVFAGNNCDDLVIELTEGYPIEKVAPNFEALAAIETRAVAVCCQAKKHSDSDPDYLLRFFAPRFGIPEDPVTGSAHCSLGPYYAKKLGKSQVIGYQASARGGLVQVEVCPEDRVLLKGNAVSIFEAKLWA